MIALDEMRFPFVFSVLFHITALVVFTISNPWTGDRDFVIPPPPPVVEILDISQVTETPKVSASNDISEDIEPPAEQVEKPAMAPLNTSEEAVVPPTLSERPPEARSPAPPEEVKKPKVTPKPPRRRPDRPKSAAAAQKPDDKAFASVLKNLVGESADQAHKPEALSDSGAEKGLQAPLGERLTISEQDALRAQLERCWHVPIGARDAENLVVDVRLVVNPDRTVREARIVDQSRYNRDSFFRAAADSALRAIRNPKCSPLAVPPDKYEQWRVVTVTFNPRGMF